MQVTRTEFMLLWASFLIIMATDLQRGILIGIVLAVFYFAWSYAQASAYHAHAAAFHGMCSCNIHGSCCCIQQPALMWPPELPFLRRNSTGCHMGCHNNQGVHNIVTTPALLLQTLHFIMNILRACLLIEPAGQMGYVPYQASPALLATTMR